MRVPASMVVRMNRASMAKWYQYFISPATTPGSLAKFNASLRMNDMPTASVTAPPVRPRSDSLPTRSSTLPRSRFSGDRWARSLPPSSASSLSTSFCHTCALSRPTLMS